MRSLEHDTAPPNEPNMTNVENSTAQMIYPIDLIAYT